MRAPLTPPRVRRRRDIRLSPPAVLALLYSALIGAGAILLMLPFAQARPFGPGEALFTATSAVTVTGLSVLDVGADLTVFGQAVIVILMQAGGLGLMAFAVLVFEALGLRVGMAHHAVLREDLNQTSVRGLVRLVWLIFRVVLVVELAGAAALAAVFVPAEGWAAGAWSALFHAVSAFNNAGFSLYPDSLSRWVADPVVNLVLPLLWIVGGIGFGVLADVGARRRWGRLSLHSKIMLSGTAVLLAVSVPLFAVLEWHNPATLGALAGPGEKIMASWFQAASTRTAGFNTVDIAGLHDATALMAMALMLIGGGSTSTAGGIKVTTAVVLLLATVAFFRRQKALHAFGRSLGLDEVLKVMALTTLALLVVVTGTFLLTATQTLPFLDLAFEATSAFGTTGLSRGATAALDGFGLSVLGVLMFLGRVGPLTLGVFLATRATPRLAYPPGRVFLG